VWQKPFKIESRFALNEGKAYSGNEIAILAGN
jgi:hypothetical protein